MCIWDGSPIQPEDERENAWEDPNDGDLPWEPPRTAKPGERWEPQDWPEDDAGPEYRLYKKQQEEEDDGA
jgi:hypothetical protein